jgi:murein DD-endopeptidase MepM/ murein hydrolase activator NlpD
MSLGSAVVAFVLALSAGAGAAASTLPGSPVEGAADAVPSAVLDPSALPTTSRGASAEERAGRWSWPLEPRPEVARRFDPPDQPWLPGHRGVDLVARVGQAVHTPTGGTVTYAARLAGRGVVVVAHPGGLRSTFEPVAATVEVGAHVAQGDSVGRVAAGAGHCAPETCLHWGVLRGRTYLDPLAFLGRGRIILLPLR